MDDTSLDSTTTQDDSPSSRLFQCSVCARSFLKNEHLVRHVRSHTKEKPYRCPNCGNKYARRDTLIRHRRDVRCKYKDNVNNATADPHPRLSHMESDTDYSDARSTVLSQDEPSVVRPASRAGGSTLPPEILTPSTTMNYSHYFIPGAHTSQSSAATSSLIQPVPDRTDMMHAEQDPFSQDALILPEVCDLRECFSSWNVDPNLHQDILQINMTPSLDSMWTIEHGPELVNAMDSRLASLQQIQRIWHSRMPDTPSKDLYYPGYALEPIYGPVTQPSTPPPDGSDIDDEYRRGLHNTLRISSCEPMIPSVDFMNVCVRLYFVKVHPIFPIIHAPTFRPCHSNAGLLMSICAMGCLFTGSDQGLRHAFDLFERTQKTTLLKWERIVAKNSEIMISIVQAMLISQLFSMLSGSQVLLLTADAFHGLPVAWLRHLKLYRVKSTLTVDLDVDGSQLEENWRKWARDEEVLRISHGLYMIDAELSQLMHREPFQSFKSYQISPTASEATFKARNACEWKLRMLSEMQHRNQSSAPLEEFNELSTTSFELDAMPYKSSLTINILLHRIGLLTLAEWAEPKPSLKALQEILKSLAVFHQNFLGNTSSHYELLQLSILWHSIHLMVLSDFELLEKAVGRDGRYLTQAEEDTLKNWAESEESLVCVKHALMIQKQVESHKTISEPALHVPRALFYAGIVVFCQMRWGPHDRPAAPQTQRVALGILKPTGPERSSEHAVPGFDDAEIDRSSLKMALFTLADILRTLGHWRICHRFADVLAALTNL